MIKPYMKDSECIIWTKAKSSYGYGQKWTGKRIEYVHRIEWAKHYGPIPEGMCVLHRCDNPPCYNVKHLFLGTKKDNMIDKTLKGRGYNPSIKLTYEQIKEIKERISSGERLVSIAKDFPISRNNISQIKLGYSWKYIC